MRTNKLCMYIFSLLIMLFFNNTYAVILQDVSCKLNTEDTDIKEIKWWFRYDETNILPIKTMYLHFKTNDQINDDTIVIKKITPTFRIGKNRVPYLENARFDLPIQKEDLEAELRYTKILTDNRGLWELIIDQVKTPLVCTIENRYIPDEYVSHSKNKKSNGPKPVKIPESITEETYSDIASIHIKAKE